MNLMIILINNVKQVYSHFWEYTCFLLCQNIRRAVNSESVQERESMKPFDSADCSAIASPRPLPDCPLREVSPLAKGLFSFSTSTFLLTVFDIERHSLLILMFILPFPEVYFTAFETRFSIAVSSSCVFAGISA